MTRMSGVPLTGTWGPFVQCSESRVRRYAVPKSTESRTNERAERFLIHITGIFYVTSLGGNRYAMLYVEDFTRFKFIRFLKHKNDAAKELREVVTELTPTLSTYPFHTNSGCGKERRILIGPW